MNENHHFFYDFQNNSEDKFSIFLGSSKDSIFLPNILDEYNVNSSIKIISFFKDHLHILR